MATYTAITDAEIDQDSPITQTLMTKYRDNLTAVTEGASGAPRVEALGRKFEALARQSATGTTAFGWTGLETDWLVQFFGSGRGSDTSGNLQIRVSANNGSTWSSWFTILALSTTTREGFSGVLNSKTGIFDYIDTTNAATVSQINTSTTNINGVQFRVSVSTGTAATAFAFGYPISRGEV